MFSFKKKNKSKYSSQYYTNILFKSASFLILISFVVFIFFGYNTISNTFEQERKSLYSENQNCYSTVNDMIENAKKISMYFAQYKEVAPLFQSQYDTNIRESTLKAEIMSFVSCFDYIAAIEISGTYYNVGHRLKTTPEFEKIQTLEPFELYSTVATSYPPFLQLRYTTESPDAFSVVITLYSEVLSNYYISENTYLLSDNGDILMSKDISLIGKNITDIHNIDFNSIKNNKEDQKYINVQTNLSSSRVTLCSLKSKSQFFKSIFLELAYLFFIYMFISSLCVLILYFILRHLYSPIKKVAQILKYYMPENDSLLESDALFIKKCSSQSNTEQEIDSALLQIRKSQLYTLHSQISPHLLGNTLESVKWDLIKVLGRNNPIEHTITTITQFLKKSYQHQQMIISVRLEIAQTKQYVDMMSYCFFQNLKVEWNIDENLFDCAIISLTLQPIIENSIIHGFKKTEENPVIKVDIHCDNNIVKIEVADNGQGMPEAILASIKKSLYEDEYTHSHIGLKNTHLKLKLLYGDEYGINSITSNQNGTIITLIIPNIPFI